MVMEMIRIIVGVGLTPLLLSFLIRTLILGMSAESLFARSILSFLGHSLIWVTMPSSVGSGTCLLFSLLMNFADCR
jgi:hypothetical protein